MSALETEDERGILALDNLERFYRGMNRLCWAEVDDGDPAHDIIGGCTRWAGACRIGLCEIHCPRVHIEKG